MGHAMGDARLRRHSPPSSRGDEWIWKDKPVGQRIASLRDGQVAGDAVARRLDLDRIGMSGHSFGALTTAKAISGESERRECQTSVFQPSIQARASSSGSGWVEASTSRRLPTFFAPHSSRTLSTFLPPPQNVSWYVMSPSAITP